jgi:hypothetical protein
MKHEPWRACGRSWNFTHYEGHVIEPQYSPLIGFPMAWTSGTDGNNGDDSPDLTAVSKGRFGSAQNQPAVCRHQFPKNSVP